jgi:HEAT repeat protein
MRVREAGVRASAAVPSATPALVERLAHDPWPLVRIAAADALAAAPPSMAAEPALARALEQDESPHVRARVVIALGAHGATAELPKIRERLKDKDEWPMVRAAAAQALAEMCDQSSLAPLTEYAQKLADPLADPNEHLLGAAALLALSDLRPKDLQERLSPLLKKGAPAQARQAADSVLHRPGACSRSTPQRNPAKVGSPAS